MTRPESLADHRRLARQRGDLLLPVGEIADSRSAAWRRDPAPSRAPDTARRARAAPAGAWAAPARRTPGRDRSWPRRRAPARCSQHPLSVGNVLDHGTQADELRSRRRACAIVSAASAALEIHPADDAGDERHVRCASSSRKRVSATVGAACTRMVEPTPARASCGARSAGR